MFGLASATDDHVGDEVGWKETVLDDAGRRGQKRGDRGGIIY